MVLGPIVECWQTRFSFKNDRFVSEEEPDISTLQVIYNIALLFPYLSE